MKYTNETIWKAAAFDHKCKRLNVRSGPREIRLRRVVARVECLLEHGDRRIVIVAAAGDDACNPTKHDRTNASLAGLVCSKQWFHRLWPKPVHVYLRYQQYIQVEVQMDLGSLENAVNEHFKRARNSNSPLTIPAPLLAYLLTQNKV